MTRIRIQTSVPYEVIVGDGVAAQAPAFIRGELHRAKKAVLVTDSNVGPLHADAVAGSLAAAGLDVSAFVFTAGERSKNLSTYGSLIDFLAAHRIGKIQGVYVPFWLFDADVHGDVPFV